ncbi:MAG: DUF1572 domain-containing protein [Saprospiraceae bacterium]|nr:DUF1572 domain-containing protein [Saprospiraceae bacterium]
MLSQQIAKHFEDVMSGNNWTSVNVKTTLEGVDWKLATHKIEGYNTLATLVYHMNYYVHEVIKVLQGSPLTASDKFAFTHPPIENQHDWETLLDQIWKDAALFKTLISDIPDDIWFKDFSDPKYGNYFRNIIGIMEHMHYHLGQIVILKKLIFNTNH